MGTIKTIYPDYKNSLISLMNSIRSYFGLETFHETLKEADQILKDGQYKNVVTILLDGLGSKIIDKHLDEKSFMRTHKIKDLSTVFPSTTTAATTAFRNGKSPIENGWLGWHQYIKEIDDEIILFRGEQYYGDQVYDKHIGYELVPVRTTLQDLDDRGIFAKEIFPSWDDDNPARNLSDFFRKINKALASNDEKKFVYAYWDDPDRSMHKLGTEAKYVHSLIKALDSFLKTLSYKIDERTIVFVVADHGHIDLERITLNNYPDFLDTLLRLPSIEARNSTLFVKEGREQEFEELFKKYFGEDYLLMKTEDVLKQELFGPGVRNELTYGMLGQYQAIAVTNKYFYYNHGQKDKHLKASHAGITEDEMLIPLIVITKENKTR